MVKILRLQFESLGEKLFRKFFKYAMQSTLIAQKGKLESAIHFALTMPYSSGDFSSEEIELIQKKGLLKDLPPEKLPQEYLDLVRKIKKRIKDFL
jgi:hypothetical protein